LNRKEEQ